MTKTNVVVPAESTAVASRIRSSTQSSNSCRETAIRHGRRWAATRILLILWLFQGFVPLTLQTRSYLKFLTPHQISGKLVVPPDLTEQTANLTEVCPMQGYFLAGIWWNFAATHYYQAEQGIVCHGVVPQYNLHGNYLIESSETVLQSSNAPSDCANCSHPLELYLYHGSIGFYSFYEGTTGTYCTKSKDSYLTIQALGTYDTNGAFLATDRGSTEIRKSYWYGIVGATWLVYRGLTIRRSYVSCKRYSRQCTELGEYLNQQEAMVFVQESLRLSAHGATNYQRSALLYLIVEGIMSDLFLIVAHNNWATWVQYVSLGYNLSGLLFLLFEMVERMRWWSEKWRQRIKRVFFSCEATLVGELVSAIMLQAFLTGLNGSDLKRSKSTALAVSYYFWSLVCHTIVVVVIVSIILSVRVPWAIAYVWIKHRSFVVLLEPCCVDSVLGARSRLMLLGGYRVENSKLYYSVAALKAFGMLKIEEDDVEYLGLHELHWFTVPRNNLVGIGVISGSRVEPCEERRCSGVVSFLDRRLGGAPTQADSGEHVSVTKVTSWFGPESGIVSSPTQLLFPSHTASDRV
ncbi:uncharacterized protein KRP23_12322 [Phytophthora ramorum]|uniref:uncharacterized protein n=1 Tax=Phytophthora ramorum TaxID=164328 RepID=UPI003096EE61|nr:hypothetical protein KRP23_12322 [Phytophthora ramorum]